MTLHVLFTEAGIPGWIGDAPREGSEALEGLDVAFLAAHQRTARGKWVARTEVRPVPPTAEEVAAQAEAAHQLALADRDRAVREALAAEADPLFFRWQRGEAAREDWLAAVAAVKARYPKPEP
ncbi:MAG TPA: hypothetical protein VI412_04655 [Tabrizicola sp.]